MATIIDLSRNMSRPFGAMLLGDLGHDVIKVEPPRIGDPAQRSPPYVKGVSTTFFSANRNKRSIVIDLKHPEGRQVLLDVVARADGVLENFRPGVMESSGLSYADLCAVNPTIVHISITGFGSYGPWRDRPSFDVVAQAASGSLLATTPDDGEPIKPGLGLSDLGVGAFGALAMQQALLRRMDTGQGQQHLEISMMDQMLAMSADVGEQYLVNKLSDEPQVDAPPNAIFPTSDGHVAVAAYTDAAWDSFCRAIGRPGWLEDSGLRTPEDRARRHSDLHAQVAGALASRSTTEWLQAFAAADVPATAVADMRETMANLPFGSGGW